MHEDEPTTGQATSDGDQQQTVKAGETVGGLLAPGERVGRYVVRERLGEGGFAEVYLAEQTEPVRRQVALKIIKLGMDTKQVIARFEAERQALAMMDHPNVAKVFDAGASETGRPYFVMEYVAGTPINEYCDRHRVNINGRLHLFMQVCEAVQHAHQKGIIHRDLKPSNVLVAVKEGEPLVKVIDFGVAKAISQRLTENTIYTEQGQLIGTPEYMSPEQAEMTTENIDTRSDIYSLGVLLYELLVGALPFDPTTLRQAAFAEIQRIIREQEPPKPSTRLSSLGDESTRSAQKRRLDPKSLLRELRGDLDWIVMKALEKDRVRRYATASDLRRDISCHLSGDAVEAAPPSRMYRASRFLRRHRSVLNGISFVVLAVYTAMMASAVVMLTGESIGGTLFMVLGVGFTAFVYLVPLALVAISIIMWRTSRDRFSLATVMLGGVWIATMGVLVAGIAKRELAPSPDERVAQHVGEGRYDEAEIIYVEQLETQRRRLGNSHRHTLLTMQSLAELQVKRSRYEEGEALLLEAFEGRRFVEGEEMERTVGVIQSLVHLYDAWGKPDKAAEWRAKLPTEQEAVASDKPGKTSADEKQDE